MAAREFVHDAYAPLSHKAPLKGIGERIPTVKSWVPLEDQRRLAAYQILAMYRDNVARYNLPDGLDEDQVSKYREYGEAQRIVVGAKTAILGDEQTIHIPGAAEQLDLPDGEQVPPAAAAAQAALEYLRGWADDEQFLLELDDTENDAIGLGDGVYTLYWDPEKGRARLQSYDPGMFFPDPDQRDGKDFPTRVHIAWEEKGLDSRARETTYLHRLTWSLDPIRPVPDPFNPANALQTDAGTVVLHDQDILTAEGTILRTYPWNVDHNGTPKPSAVTCHFTHAMWDLRDIQSGLHNLSALAAEYLVRDQDLKIDFLPVLHVPNTPARRGFFGRSILTLVAQILDDLAATNTDLLETGALAGNATLITKGGPAAVAAGPGAHLELDLDGDASYLDTSKVLDALLKLKGDLKDNLSEISRIAKATLGRTDGSNTVSGLQLALSFSPTEDLSRESRLVRNAKYPLLLKWVVRFAQMNGDLAGGPTPRAELLFGSFLPADRSQAVTSVKELLAANAISTHTGVLILQQAGFPIEDAVAEVERIEQENFAAAVLLVEATGNVGDAYRMLGLRPAAADGSEQTGA